LTEIKKSPLHDRLAEIQKSLVAPKSQFNEFGGYHYRSCEDILVAVKPLLGGLVLTVEDDIIAVGDRVYVKATATLTDGIERIHVSAFAREALQKKGMDEAQVTGSASSYARKYALNGLLLIDDTKDPDHGDNRGSGNGGNPGADKKDKPFDLQKVLPWIAESKTVAQAETRTKNALAKAGTAAERKALNEALATFKAKHAEKAPA
jgi:hypothetical protein